MMDNMNGCELMCVGMWIGGILVLILLVLLVIWLIKKIKNSK